jgi:thymidylate synthase ThyX
MDAGKLIAAFCDRGVFAGDLLVGEVISTEITVQTVGQRVDTRIYVSMNSRSFSQFCYRSGVESVSLRPSERASVQQSRGLAMH